ALAGRTASSPRPVAPWRPRQSRQPRRTAGRPPEAGLLVEEDVRQQRRAGLDRVGLEVGHAFAREHVLVEVEISGGFARIAGKDRMRGVGEYLRLAAVLQPLRH